MNTKETNYPALYSVILIFFFWGFIPAGNSIFIPFCKEYFSLDQFQSQLIDFSFYLAYYLGAVILFAISLFIKKEPIGALGYKKSTILGLLISSIGAVMMIYNLYQANYNFILLGLFVVGLGFSLQQTSVYPFVISLGDEKTGPNRTSLGGAINSIGTTIGPLIIAFALFGSSTGFKIENIKGLSLDTVGNLYSIVAIVFVLLALFYFFSKNIPDEKIESKNQLPIKSFWAVVLITTLLALAYIPVLYSYANTTVLTKEETAELELNRLVNIGLSVAIVVFGILLILLLSRKNPNRWGAMKFPQLTLGMLAIFFYVGVEVAVGNNLGEYVKTISNEIVPNEYITPIISMYWGSLMVGRWASSVYVFKLSKRNQLLALVLLPILAFIIVLTVNYLMGQEVDFLFQYIIAVLIMVVGFVLSKNKPILTLMIFSVLGILACFIGVYTSGMFSIYAFLFTGLCCSIMWPCIFSLALVGLGEYKSQGSSFLIMMILGGALIPPLQGKLADVFGTQNSYYISLLCFVYILFYAVIIPKIFKRQEVSID